MPKHAARCEFSDVMGRVMALYQECVLFDELQLCLVGHSKKKWMNININASDIQLGGLWYQFECGTVFPE